MNKEQQIEEMAKIIQQVKKCDKLCVSQCDPNCRYTHKDLTCLAQFQAEALYDAGYRKETAKEILRRMAKFMNEEFCGDDAPCNYNDYDEFMYDNCKDYCEMNCENSDCRECWYQFLKARLKIR